MEEDNTDSIKIYTNESIPVAVAEGLKRRGVKAWSAKDTGNLGLTDIEQLQYAIKKEATIFTHDDDFLSLVAETDREHHGIIYVHQQKLSTGECIRRIKTLVQTKTPEDMEKHIEFL